MNWKNRYIHKIETFEKVSNHSDHKHYKTKKLKIMVESVFVFALDHCHDCEIYQSTLERMIDSIGNEQKYKEYVNLYCLVRNHLVKDHGYIQTFTSLTYYLSGSLLCGLFLGHYLQDKSWIIFVCILLGLSLGIRKELNAKYKGISL